MTTADFQIGTAGWAIPGPLRERFAGTGTQLERYGRVLGCAEINSSFHRPHRRSTYERWAASVPADFRFAVKLPKTITHKRRLADCDDELDGFLNESGGLGERRHVLLMQLPPSFAYDETLVGRFFTAIRDRYDGLVTCEPRHPSWFDGDANALMMAYRVARVAADPPIGEPMKAGGWDGIAYFRLHGAPRMYYSNYDAGRLREFAQTIQGATAPQRWCIFDNTTLGAALENALSLTQLLDGA